MAVWTEEIMNPSLIENTTMVKRFSDGVHKTYRITPNEGYVLHDKNLDIHTEFDENGNGIGEVSLGFYAGTTSVRYDYDFTANPREFYAVLESSVPADQIYSGGNNNHEVM